MVPTRRRSSVLAALLAVGVAAALVGVGPASGAEIDSWATIGLAGSAGAYTGTITLPGAFPATTFASTSRQATVVSGASTWQAASTPVGAVYSSSANRPYLNLRPAADNAASPAVTTYTFAAPTPRGGWSFVLGDIDADQVTLMARGVGGAVVPVSALGFGGAYNYCHRSGGPSCDSANLNEVPTWTPSGNSGVLVGNPQAADTEGAAAWFSPTVPLTSLTMTYGWRAGFPTYQTWFVDKTFAASGTVTLDGAPVAGSVVTIVDASGRTVATTTSGPDGVWTVPSLVAAGGYQAHVSPPPPGVEGLDPRSFELSAGDATAVDFPFVSPPPPTAAHDDASTEQGSPVSVDLLANDAPGAAAFPLVPGSATFQLPAGAPAGSSLSPDRKTLTIGGEGTYTLDASGTATFTPVPSFSGAGIPAPYTVLDTNGVAASATLTIVVTAVTPVANPDAAATRQGASVTIDPLAVDQPGAPDVPLVPSTVVLDVPAGAPAGSTVTSDGKNLTIAGQGTYTVDAVTGEVTFQPLPAFIGLALAVPYTVADTNGTTASSTIRILVVAAGVPVASPDAGSTLQGMPSTIDPLDNDSAATPANPLVPSTVALQLPAGAPPGSSVSPDGKTLTISGQGTYTVDAVTGQVTFTPLPAFSGAATPIDYTVRDTAARAISATITFDVTPVAPLASPDMETTLQGIAVTVDALGNDNAGNPAVPLVASTLRLAVPAGAPAGTTLSADGKTLTLPGEGVYSVAASGAVSFQPEAAFSGIALAVPYTVADENGTVAPSTIRVDVVAVTPAANADQIATEQGQAVSLDLLGNDSPGNAAVPLDPATVALQAPPGAPAGTTLSPDSRALTIPGEGVYTVDAATGAVSFQPDDAFTGTGSDVPYSVADANGTRADATLTVVVTAVVPIASPISATTPSGVAIDVSPLDSDAPGDPAVPLEPSTLTLDVPATAPAGSTLSPDGRTLTLPGEGTFVVDPATGEVLFTPDATFSGSTPPIPYTVADANGTVAGATITITVEPSTVEPPPTSPPGSGSGSSSTGGGAASSATETGSGLAATGSDPIDWLLLAAGLVVGGVLLRSIRRPRA